MGKADGKQKRKWRGEEGERSKNKARTDQWILGSPCIPNQRGASFADSDPGSGEILSETLNMFCHTAELELGHGLLVWALGAAHVC